MPSSSIFTGLSGEIPLRFWRFELDFFSSLSWSLSSSSSETGNYSLRRTFCGASRALYSGPHSWVCEAMMSVMEPTPTSDTKRAE